MSSCLEITEKIEINKDLSGRMTYGLQTVEQNDLLSELLKLVTTSSVPVEQELRYYADKLKKEEGISNVRLEVLAGHGKFELSFDFKDHQLLNDALYNVFDVKSPIKVKYLKVGKHKVKKRNISPYAKKYIDKNEDIYLPDEMLPFISLRSSVTVPGKIKRVKCKKCDYSDDKKTVTKISDLKKVIDNKVSTGIVVKY